jgi:hypothetical protein
MTQDSSPARTLLAVVFVVCYKNSQKMSLNWLYVVFVECCQMASIWKNALRRRYALLLSILFLLLFHSCWVLFTVHIHTLIYRPFFTFVDCPVRCFWGDSRRHCCQKACRSGDGELVVIVGLIWLFLIALCSDWFGAFMSLILGVELLFYVQLFVLFVFAFHFIYHVLSPSHIDFGPSFSLDQSSTRVLGVRSQVHCSSK